MLARILTENVNYQDVVQLVSEIFDGATLIKADGLWHSKIEHSLVIEILVDHNQLSDVERLAYNIKKHNKQDAVLVQYVECQSKMI